MTNLELQNKINRAIEFIENYKFKGYESLNERYLDNVLCDMLLDILGGTNEI